MNTETATKKKTRTYKQIAEKYGMTIPAVKKIFRQAGWLNANAPAPAALESGIASLRLIESGRYGSGEQIIWDLEAVEGLMKETGCEQLNDLTKQLYIRNRHQASDRLSDAASGMAVLLGIDTGTGNWNTPVKSAIGWMLFESFHVILWVEDDTNIRQEISQRFDLIFSAASRKKKIDTAMVQHWRKVVENTIVWLEKLQARERNSSARQPSERDKPGFNEFMEAHRLHEAGDHEEALAMYDLALNLNPDQTAIYEAKGNLLLQLDRVEDALKTFTHGNEKLSNDSEDCWLGIGRALFRLGHTERARDAFTSGLESCLNSMKMNISDDNTMLTLASLHDWLGTSEHALDNYTAAIRHFRQASDINPHLIYPYYGAGRAAIRLKEPHFAVERLTKALAVSEEQKSTAYTAYIHEHLGMAYHLLGDHEQARKSYDEALKLDDTVADFHTCLGHLLLIQGKTEEAINQYRIACSLEPGNGTLHFDLQAALKFQTERESQKSTPQENDLPEEDWRANTNWPDVIG